MEELYETGIFLVHCIGSVQAAIPEWKNSRENEVVIKVPKRAVIHVGKVAPQKSKEYGTYLPGGADQVLIPYPFPEEWWTNEDA